MTGLELAYECCRPNRELRVLYVSGSMPGHDLRADLAMGRRGFLAKPFRQSDLLRSAKALLAMEPAGPQSRANPESRMERLSVERWL